MAEEARGIRAGKGLLSQGVGAQGRDSGERGEGGCYLGEDRSCGFG